MEPERRVLRRRQLREVGPEPAVEAMGPEVVDHGRDGRRGHVRAETGRGLRRLDVVDEERQSDRVIEVRMRDQDMLDAGLRSEGEGARHRSGLEEDMTVDEEAGQAPLGHAATVAAKDLEEHAARGCQALAPCRIVSGAVVAPLGWLAPRGPRTPGRVEDISHSAQRKVKFRERLRTARAEDAVSWVKTNHVKRALREGRPTAGAWLSLCGAISAEIMSRAGFDWLLVDMEHGHGDFQTLLAQLQAIEGSETIPVVRVQWNDPAVIKRVLDIGAYGVMVPWIGGRAEAEAAVRAAKYPPDGIRGIAGSHRAGGYGRHAAESWKRANEEILVVLQVETLAAVDEIDP